MTDGLIRRAEPDDVDESGDAAVAINDEMVADARPAEGRHVIAGDLFSADAFRRARMVDHELSDIVERARGIA